MTAKVFSFRKPALEIGCSACGTTVEAGCDCGVPYMPAGQRAAEAIKANPQLNNVQLAELVGVSDETVRRARKSMSTDVDIGPRLRSDGKPYPAMLKPRSVPEVNEDSPSELRKAFLFYSYEAKLLARYDGPVDKEVIESALQTAAAWQLLATTLQGNANG